MQLFVFFSFPFFVFCATFVKSGKVIISSQSRYNSGCLSPIFDRDFQFWAIWAVREKISIMNYWLLLGVMFSCFRGHFFFFFNVLQIIFHRSTLRFWDLSVKVDSLKHVLNVLLLYIFCGHNISQNATNHKMVSKKRYYSLIKPHCCPQG